MTGSLFKFDEKGEVSEIDDRLYLVPEFKKLLKSKNGKKHIKYVYCYCDYYSPYVREPDLNQRAMLLRRDVYNDKYRPENNELIADAISKYNELQKHPLHEQYKVMERKRFEMTDAIDSLNAKEDISKVMKLSNDLSKYTKEIKLLSDMIQEQNSKIGGMSGLSRNLSLIEKQLRKK